MRPSENAAEQSKTEEGRSTASRPSSPSIMRSLRSRKEHRNSGWTAYGNQVERRLF
jgi:hypothetical protein